MQLDGKRTLITGAGSGIGRALAVEASRRGMTVALCGRRAEALRDTIALMDRSSRHLLLPADVTVPAQRRELRDTLAQAWDGLDVLINNAGIVSVGPFLSTDDEELQRMVATNVTAPVALTREMVPLLQKAAPSRIVNMGSIYGDIAYPLVTAYSASKFALRGLSVALRRELKPLGIAVTYAAPRATRTAAADGLDPLIEPLQIRFDTPDKVAIRIWKAVARDANAAYAAGPERLFVLVQRLFPSLVDRAIAKQMADPRVEAYVRTFRKPVRAHAAETRSGGPEPGQSSLPHGASNGHIRNGSPLNLEFSED